MGSARDPEELLPDDAKEGPHLCPGIPLGHWEGCVPVGHQTGPGICSAQAEASQFLEGQCVQIVWIQEGASLLRPGAPTPGRDPG